ncbi:mechanosensitive ion channel family protein [Candidatus Chloroploca sp. M-50]|uniref:Mechanosensitive ion channel family protein n=1 Tax=Candidatus Chloroploca mongolica TaxID=2528176 RepID=A0ABS4DAA7_9CHLR|nr:mechanosensitive ion channel family protein [Candidatus Chloroploca mongolica]MBP1466388.1 mechanosensitive ion channel family protein [Candidatus Chloroploca mongolica]
MVEAYDAANNSAIFQAYTFLLAVIAIGALIEFGILKLLKRYAIRRKWFFAEVALRALGGQAIFWLSFLGLASTLATVVPDLRIASAVRLLLNLMAVLTAMSFLVRLVTNSIRIYFIRHTMGSISLLNNVLRGFTFIVLGTTAMAYLGVPIGPLVTILAGSSIGLSLALREPLANLFSGIMILATNKIQLGDYVRLSTGQEGFVDDIRWADTYLRELTENLLVVPNSLMTNTILTNFDRPNSEFLIFLPVAVPYDSDLARVEALLVEEGQGMMHEELGGVPEHTVRARLAAFGELGVQFNIILRTREFNDQFPLRHEFYQRVFARFASEGLPQPIPIQRIRIEPVRNGTAADLDQSGRSEHMAGAEQ